MSVKLFDRVKQVTLTQGTGVISFSTTPAGFQSFSGVFSNNDQTYYVIENKNTWEVGRGTYNNNTLSRLEVLDSSNNGQRIDLSGKSNVFVTLPADKIIFTNESGRSNLDIDYLNNVRLSLPSSGQNLTYNGQYWVNNTPAPGYSDEQAQDAIGGIITNSSNINLSYNDNAPSISAVIPTGAITNELLATGIDVNKLSGVINSSNLPSYVDDVLEFANFASLPPTGESGKIYLIVDTNRSYRWTGSQYAQITDTTALWGSITGTITDQTDLIEYIDNNSKLNQYVKNSTHTTLYKGQAVYINGSDGTNPTVALAVASGEATSSKTLGFLKQDLLHGEFGYVVTEGELGGLNTNEATSEGDPIWLSPTTPGGVIYGLANKPYAPNHLVFMGVVIRKNINNGRIYVKVQNGFELKELHDVSAQSPSDGDIIRYVGSSGLWMSTPMPVSYTDENAQDAVGGMVQNSSNVSLSYTDNTPSLIADLVDTTVVAGAYGSTNQVATFTVDAKGRLTAAANATITPFSIGALGSLNGLTDSTQTFATGTSGTNFNIVSSGTAHTFNIPDASATNRGLVTTGSQTIAGAKAFTTAIKVALPNTSTNPLGNSNPPNTQWVYLVNTTNVVNRPIGIVFGGYDGFYHLALQSTMTSGGGNTFGKVSFVGQQGFEYLRVSTASTDLGVTVGGGLKFAAFSQNLVIDCAIERDAANALAVRNGANAQTYRIYNTFTDASNYERLALQFGTYSSARHAQLAAESAGTGAANINLVLTPKGTGAFMLGPPPDGTATGGNARGQYAVDLQLYRSAATQVASDYGVAIGSQITVSGNVGSIGIGRNVNVTDSLGGATGIGRNVTVAGYRGIGIGAGVQAGSDTVVIGTGAIGNHNGAACIGADTQSQFDGKIHWASRVTPLATSYSATTYFAGRQYRAPAVRTINTTPTTLYDTLVTTPIQSRFRHLTAILFVEFTIFAITSGQQLNKYQRKVLVKDVSNNAGSASTLTILQIETVGTDIVEIPGVSFSVAVDSATKKLIISVTGQADYAVTGDSSSDILTAVGNNFVDGDVVVFTALTGGDGFITNTVGLYYQGIYRVMNKSGDTFQLSVANSSTPTPVNFTTDITAGTICRPISWYTDDIKFTAASGGY